MGAGAGCTRVTRPYEATTHDSSILSGSTKSIVRTTDDGSSPKNCVVAAVLEKGNGTMAGKKSVSDIGTRPLTLTLIRDQTGSVMKPLTFTLPEWRDQIQQDGGIIDKTGLLWLKGALFGVLKSEKGSYRHDANVTAITAVMVEHDTGKISFDKAIATLKKAKLRWLAYTSPSYKKVEKEKWRLVLPLSSHAKPERHVELVAAINGLFDGQLAPESFTLSQAYYFGPVNGNVDHRCEIGDGDFLDLRSDLAAKCIYKDGGNVPPKSRSRKGKRRLERNHFHGLKRDDVDPDKVRFALSKIDADDYLVWMKVGAGLANQYGEDGRDIFHDWSATSNKYQESFCDEKFEDFAAMTEFSIATIFFLADEADENWREEFKNRPADDAAVKPSLNGKSSSIIIHRADQILMRPKQWLWRGRLLSGAQEMITGQPGLGKSQLQIDLMARATTGRNWPDGVPGIDPVNVLMLTAEDTLDQEVVPRLSAAQADLAHIHIIKCIRKDDKDRQFLLGQDLDRLKDVVRDIGKVGLICIDPITAYMGGKIDSHKTTDVRGQLGPLKDFAEEMNVAISTITHPPKGGGQRAIDSFIGSQAFIAVARIGHICIEEIEFDEETREKTPTGRMLFCDVKNNAARRGTTLAYRIEQVTVSGSNPFDLITAPHIVWQGAVDVNADDALAAHSVGRGRKSEEQVEAQKFLRELLADGKPIAKAVIIEKGAAYGFSEKQIRTAKENLNIQAEKIAFDGGWSWKLPKPPKPLPPRGRQP